MKKRINKILTTTLLPLTSCALISPTLVSCSNKNFEKVIQWENIKPRLNSNLFANSSYLKRFDSSSSNKISYPYSSIVLQQLFSNYTSLISNDFTIKNISYYQNQNLLEVKFEINDEKNAFLYENKYYHNIIYSLDIPYYVVPNPIVRLKNGINSYDIPDNIQLNQVNQFVTINNLDTNVELYDVNVGGETFDKELYLDFKIKDTSDGCAFKRNDSYSNKYRVILDVPKTNIVVPPNPKLKKDVYISNSNVKNIDKYNIGEFLENYSINNVLIDTIYFNYTSEIGFNYIYLKYVPANGFIFEKGKNEHVCKIQVNYGKPINTPSPTLKSDVNSSNNSLINISVSNLVNVVENYECDNASISEVNYDNVDGKLLIKYVCKPGFMFNKIGSTYVAQLNVPRDPNAPPIYIDYPIVKIKDGIFQNNSELLNLDKNNLDEFANYQKSNAYFVNEAHYESGSRYIIINFQTNSGYLFKENKSNSYQVQILVPRASIQISPPYITCKVGINTNTPGLENINVDNYQNFVILNNFSHSFIEVTDVIYDINTKTIKMTFEIKPGLNYVFKDNSKIAVATVIVPTI